MSLYTYNVKYKCEYEKVSVKHVQFLLNFISDIMSLPLEKSITISKL